MNLLERLQQGQTLLSAGSFPGDAPINDPQSGFVQDNSPTNTYESETVGQPNNGSALFNTLDNTALDITDPTSTTDTATPTFDWVTNYPPLVKGEFNGAPSLYGLAYAAENTYLDNVPIQDPNSPQLSTLEQTGLDNIDTNSEPTTITPNSVSYPNNYPELVSGEFGSAPSQYSSPYNSTNTYLDNVSIEDPNSPQLPTLEQTGLDNTNTNSEPTSVTPNSISSPNNYPELVSGEFGGAPSPYGPQYNVESTYLNSIDDINNTPQVTSLFFTGLDNTNANAEPTTVVPSNISYPNNYPVLTSGEFNGAPSQYESPYNSTNTYLDNVPIQDPNSPQLPTLEETGLDLVNGEHSPTTIVPDSIAYPNNYPAIEGVNLGGFGGPEQYDTNWNQENTYLNSFNPDSENSIQLSFTGSNLDNSSTGVSALSHVIPPISIYKPNDYPIIPNVNLGEFNSGPSQYTTPYTPNEPYLGQYNEIKNIATNPQTNTLDETALDVEDPAALPSSLLFAPTNPDNITVYPSANVTGVTGSAPQPFNQVWRPSNEYYSYMKENYEVR